MNRAEIPFPVDSIIDEISEKIPQTDSTEWCFGASILNDEQSRNASRGHWQGSL
jgi:hypothetical protein